MFSQFDSSAFVIEPNFLQLFSLTISMNDSGYLMFIVIEFRCYCVNHYQKMCHLIRKNVRIHLYFLIIKQQQKAVENEINLKSIIKTVISFNMP